MSRKLAAAARWRRMNPETIRIPCAGCGEIIPTQWSPGGGLLRSRDYELVADCVFHTDCWDKLITEHPPGEDA